MLALLFYLQALQTTLFLLLDCNIYSFGQLMSIIQNYVSGNLLYFKDLNN